LGKEVENNMAKQSKHDPKAVTSYLATLPAGKRKALEALRNLIKGEDASIQERISYGTSVIFSLSKDLVGLVAQTNHLSFFIMSPALATKMKAEISKTHELSGATIHFNEDNPLPNTLVQKIVRARIVENAK